MPIEQGAARENEAQIAVHWKEEDYVLPSPKFVAQANLTDRCGERFIREHFPDCFKEYADLLDWYQDLGHHARHKQSAVLEMVRRRQDSTSVTTVSIAISPSTRTRRRSISSPSRSTKTIQHVTYQELYVRVNEVAALLQRLLRSQEGRPSDAAHADGGGAADHDARLRAARRHSLAGL